MPVEPAILLLFLGTIIVFILTPGPNMIFCVSRAITGGPATGIYSALGVCLGLTIHATAAGLGLSQLFIHFPLAYDILRISGGAYLLWLAWRSWRDSLSTSDALFSPSSSQCETGAGKTRAGITASLLHGALNALLSPKAVFFYLVLFPQFLDPAKGSILVQSLFLILIINVINFAVISALCIGAGRAAYWLTRHPAILAWQRRFAAGVFVALALRVLHSRAPASPA